MSMFGKNNQKELKTDAKTEQPELKNLHQSDNKRKANVIDDEDEVVISKKAKIEPDNTYAHSIDFNKLVTGMTQVEACKGENSKDQIKEIFANIFKDIILNSPDDLTRAYSFLLSKVGPEYKSPELGIGNENLVKSLSKAIGKSEKWIKERTTELGDLGLVAQDGKKSVVTMDKFNFSKTEKKPLTLKQVMDSLLNLANIKGKQSYAEKEKILVKLMFSADKDELKFIVRSLQKSLKIGASFKTIISSLSRAVSKINKMTEKEIERMLLISINQLADYELVMNNLINSVKTDFNKLTELCKITPGIPLKPQLARPTTSINIIFQRFEGVPFSCEYKYDGFRGQVHYFNKTTQIFSRNLENMTESYPDIVAYFKDSELDSFIVDCEIVAFDKKTNKILPFQQLTTRSRKNVNVDEISINVCMFLFDIIYLNGKNLCELTLDERRKILLQTFKETEQIKFAKFINSEKFEEIDSFMQESLIAGIILNLIYALMV